MKVIDITCWTAPFWAKGIYYSIRDFFNPRQKWLTKKIPNSWSDKTWLIAMIATESIIHFIEEEEAFERIEWNSTPEHAEAAKEFKRAYQYIRIKIPILEEKNKKLWKDKELSQYFDNGFIVPLAEGGHEIKSPTGKPQEILAQIRENDAEIEWLIQEVVEIVTKYRNYMWT